MSRSSLLVFLTVFVVQAYFYNGASWNQQARLNPVYSFVETGHEDHLTFRMDRFITDPDLGINTGDWARFQGHYYSNKAPGTTFLALPVYFALYNVEKALGIDHTEPFWIQLNAYVLNLWTSVLWAALAAVALYVYQRRRPDREGRPAPLFLVALFSFGTLMLPFSTQIWGHTTAAAMLLIAWCLRGERAASSRVVCGSMLGLAVIVDYQAAAGWPVLLVAMLLERRPLKSVATVFAAAGAWLFALLLYHKLQFGGFFVTAPQLSNPAMLDDDRLAGNFGSFSGEALFALTLSWSRGVFVYMPFLVFPLLQGLRRLVRAPHPPTIACLAMIAIVFYAISCFIGWHGGNTTGSRYLVITMPFFLLLAETPRARWARVAFYLTCCIAWSNMLVITAVDTMMSPLIANPWWDNLYARFLSGDFPQETFLPHVPQQHEYEETSFNLGNVLGLRGLPSLLPLLAVLVPLGALTLRSARRAS